MVFQAVYDKCQNYYDQIPQDTLPVIAKSALYSFSYSIITLNNPRQPWDLTTPLLKAGVAALAASIYALTTPFFNWVFGDNEILIHREFVKSFSVMAVTTVIFANLTSSKVNYTALPFIVMLDTNAIFSILDIYPTCMTWVDPQFGQWCRNTWNWLGMTPIPGSACTHLVWEILF